MMKRADEEWVEGEDSKITQLFTQHIITAFAADSTAEATNWKWQRWTCGWCLKARLEESEKNVSACGAENVKKHFFFKHHQMLRTFFLFSPILRDCHSLGLFLLKSLFSLLYTCSLSVKHSRAERGGEHIEYCSHGNLLLIYFSTETVQKQPGKLDDRVFLR